MLCQQEAKWINFSSRPVNQEVLLVQALALSTAFVLQHNKQMPMWKSPRGGWIGKSKIYKLKHTLQAAVSVRNINKSEREGENKSQANKSG
jgi:hypothetical protein